MADSSSSAASATHVCTRCQAVLESRNKLFKHLKVCSDSQQEQDGQLAKAPRLDQFTVDLNNFAVYVTGGRVRGRTLGTVERFSFREGKWELVASLLQNRGSHGAATVNGHILVFGGGGFDSNLQTCEMLDVKENKWSFVASSTTFRHALALVSFQMKMGNDIHPSVFALGGWIDGKFSSGDVERYDSVLNTWTTCASMIVPRKLLGAASHGDSVFVFGGNCDGETSWYTNAVERYDPYANAWTRLKDLPLSGPTSAASVGDFIYVFLHGKHALRYNPITDTYEKRSDLPLPQWFTFDVTTCGPYVFLHGGASDGVWSKAFFRYDVRYDSWERLPDMLRQRRRCAAAIVQLEL